MPRQAIKQAEHEECDSDDSEFTVMDREFPNINNDEEMNSIVYDVRCSCGDTGTITVDEEGTHASDDITYENASWNQEEDDE